MTQKKSILNKHSLFNSNKSIQNKTDVIDNKLELYGEKIIIDIPIHQISIQPQVRKTFDKDKIQLLANDIKSKGLIHPVTVIKDPKNKNSYILIIGGNRIEAFKLLNKKSIPCIVKQDLNDEGDIQLLQLAENMHRNDLNPVELAEALLNIKKITGYTLNQIAKTVGRSIDSIKQYSRISKLTKEEKTYHVTIKSTKNDILNYLSNKTKSKHKKSYLTFVKTTNKSEKKDQQKNELEALKKQIKEAEKFIIEAKKKLNNTKY